MQKIFYTTILLIAVSFITNAQIKATNKKWPNDFLNQLRYNHQSFRSGTPASSLKSTNPFWESVTAPHSPDSYIFQMTIPSPNSVWAKVGIDTLGNDTKYFIQTADGGKTWRYDSIETPQGYVIGSISAIDGNTCYASMYEPSQTRGIGGGIFKTTNGGATWKQLGAGKIFDANSNPDLVYFFDAKHGIAVGDGNGPGTPYMEIYTTDDEGNTWVRVPRENIPPVITGKPYGLPVPNNTVYKNRLWFRGFDDAGANYIYRSDDFGHHWQLFNTTYYTDFAFSDKQNGIGFAGDNTGPIINATHDGGATWNKISYSGTQFVFLSVIPGTHTFVSSLPGSSYSNDYGATWNIIDSGINDLHSELAFLNPLVGWNGQAFDTDPTGGIFKWKIHFPFQCSSFAATNANNKVLLNWQIENDWNNDYYTIERSADQTNFSEIGKVKSIVNTSQSQAYNFEDNNSLRGQQYYRLKQVDINGNISYSRVINIDFTSATLKIYPNPAKNIVKVEGLNPSIDRKLSLIDGSGKMLKELNTTSQNYTFDLQKLAAGSYYIKIESDKKVTTLRFVKE